MSNAVRPVMRTDLPGRFDQVYRNQCARISHLYITAVEKKVAKLPQFQDLNRHELMTLVIIDGYNGPITPTFVSDMLVLNPATISRTLKVLVEKDLVTVIPNMHDTRSTLLSCAPSGAHIADKFRQKCAELIQRIDSFTGEGLSDEERSSVSNALELLNRRAENFLSWNHILENPSELSDKGLKGGPKK